MVFAFSYKSVNEYDIKNKFVKTSDSQTELMKNVVFALLVSLLIWHIKTSDILTRRKNSIECSEDS